MNRSSVDAFHRHAVIARLAHAALAVTISVAALSAPLSAQSRGTAATVAGYRPTANRLIEGALADTTGFIRLAELVDTHGHRLSGSASLETAIDWLAAKLKADGFDNEIGRAHV